MSEWHDPDRFLAGLDLYRAGKAPRLLLPVGRVRSGRPTSRGAALSNGAQQLGIPAGVMASTPPVVKTAEEAVAIRRLLEASGNGSVPSPRTLMVTSTFYMRRAQRLFERQVMEPFPVDFQARGFWASPFWCDPTQWFP